MCKNGTFKLSEPSTKIKENVTPVPARTEAAEKVLRAAITNRQNPAGTEGGWTGRSF